MKLGDSVRRLTTPLLVAGVVMAAVAAVVVVPVGNVTPVSAACTLCAGGEFHPVTPKRIYDTRAAELNGGVGPINDLGPFIGIGKPMTTADPTFEVDLYGTGNSSYINPWLPAGVVPSDVLAVVASITVVNPFVSGYLGVYPAGTAITSNNKNSVINFKAGKTTSNLAVLRPDANGRLWVELHGVADGSAHILIDVFGWFSTSTYTAGTPGDETDERGARLVAIDPRRIVDTRPVAPLGPDSEIPVRIRGAQAADGSGIVVPDSPNVVGVVLNLTVIKPTANGYVSVVPEGVPAGTPPTTSNANTTPGLVKGTLVFAPVGADGFVHVFNKNGSTNVALDVMGYLVTNEPEPSRNGRVVPLSAPFRAFDTRKPEFGAVPLGPAQAEDWSFSAFSTSVNIGGVPVGNQAAFIGNLTNAGLTRQFPTVAVEPSYLTVYPTPASAGAPPLISNLNSVETGPVPNLALVTYGANQTVRVFNAKGYSHYIFDVSAVVLKD
jgi:hypothetical protein